MRRPGRGNIDIGRLLFACLIVAAAAALIVTLLMLRARLLAVEKRLSELGGGSSEMSAPQEESPNAPEALTEPDAELAEGAVNGIEELLRARNAGRAERLLKAITEPDGAYSVVDSGALSFRQEGKLHGSLMREGISYFRVTGREARGTVTIQSRTGASLEVEGPESGVERFVSSRRRELDTVVERMERLKRRLRELPDAPAVAAALQEREMHATGVTENDFLLRRGFATEDGTLVVRVAADAQSGELRVNGETLEEPSGFEQRVAQAVRRYDPAEQIRRVTAELRERLSRLLQDGGFQRFLSERGLSVAAPAEEPAEEPAEAPDRPRAPLRYALESEAGEQLGALVIRPQKGSITLESTDGSLSETLVEVATGRGAGNVGGERTTFLLLGVRKGLSDSIMLARAGPERISTVSIPRDIYRGGLKLNELYHAEGPAAIVEAVSEITGVEIDHYMAVSVEGLAEIIRALGTITVEITEEILDPEATYQVDGETRMLYFPPGEHELSANAVLKLARSRRTTSDFDRAERQRQIITGLRERLKELSLTDAGRLYDLLRTALEHTDTQMSFGELLAFYRRYRDVEQTRHKVLSTENVLYSTYRALYERGLPLARAETMATEELGAWILRPRHEDWNLVAWYVNRWLSGAEPDTAAYLARRFPLTGSSSDTLMDELQLSSDAVRLKIFPLEEQR